MDWTIDIDPEDQLSQQASPQSESDNESNAEAPKIVIPTAKKIRAATLEGIRIGILPEYQDYSVVLQYLVNQFMKNDFKFDKVQRAVPWLDTWLVNPFNSRLLNEELELAAKLEASKIGKQIQFILQGGYCSKTIGKLCSCICCCLPLCAVWCRVCTYCADLCLACTWGSFFDWWLGAFCRAYILSFLCYIPKFLKLKLEDLMVGEASFEDEELSIRNIYDSNSYRIANQYACLLFLAITLMLLGGCMVGVSYVYLQRHPDKLFIRAESVLGIVLLATGWFGMQFYCRCTL